MPEVLERTTSTSDTLSAVRQRGRAASDLLRLAAPLVLARPLSPAEAWPASYDFRPADQRRAVWECLRPREPSSRFLGLMEPDTRFSPEPEEILRGQPIEAPEEDMLDWDFVLTPPPPKRQGTILVELRYAGRSKPLPADNPWVE